MAEDSNGHCNSQNAHRRGGWVTQTSRQAQGAALNGERVQDTADLAPRYREFMFLPSESTFQKRVEDMISAKVGLEPYELSTQATADKLTEMSTNDLKASFCYLWSKCYEALFVVQREYSAPEYFCNWMCIDLCRRCNELYIRFQREHTGSDEQTDAFKRWLHEAGYKKRFFNKARFLNWPLLDGGARSRLLDLVNTFGDEICFCSDFIDMLKVASMDEDTYRHFYAVLDTNRESLLSVLSHTSRAFKGTNPVKPFETAVLLNP